MTYTPQGPHAFLRIYDHDKGRGLEPRQAFRAEIAARRSARQLAGARCLPILGLLAFASVMIATPVLPGSILTRID
jgi:hypothetical protein